MGQRIITNTPEFANLLKERRQFLKLTIEEAAKKAGVGTKTWYRYEAGEDIREDKCKGICKALDWRSFPGTDVETEEEVTKDCKENGIWSQYIADSFGEHAATVFSVGCDNLLYDIDEDLSLLQKKPLNTHLGELEYSTLLCLLPEQFIPLYNYDFLFHLRLCTKKLISRATGDSPLIIHSVAEELIMKMIVDETSTDSNDKDWIYDLFDDMDIETFLFSDLFYLEPDDTYHFSHWFDQQFYMEG